MRGPGASCTYQPGVTSCFICGLRTSCRGRGGAGQGDTPEPGREGAGEAQSPAVGGQLGGAWWQWQGPEASLPGAAPSKGRVHTRCWDKQDSTGSHHALRDAPMALLKLPRAQASQATATNRPSYPCRQGQACAEVWPLAPCCRLAVCSYSGEFPRYRLALVFASLGPSSTPRLRLQDP